MGVLDWAQNTFGGENAPQWLQAVANTPKYWSTKNIEANLPFQVDVARGQSLEDAAQLRKTGFGDVRTKDINLGTGMNRGVFVGYGDEASDIADMYAKGPITRGTKLGEVTGEAFQGKVPKSAMQFSRNVWGHPQAIIPAGWANKAFNLPGGGIMDAIQKSKLTRFLARAFPGANIGLGGASVASRVAKGQPVRAGMAAASMVPGPIGWAGLGAETAADYIVSADAKRKAAEEEAARRAAAAKAAAIKGGAAGASASSGGGGQGGGGQGGGGGGQAAGQRPSRTSRPSGYAAVRRYGRADGGMVGLDYLTRRL